MQSTSLIFLALMVAVFYLLLIRPQQKRMKQHHQLVSSLRLGDEVVTIGGLFGQVKRLDEGHVWLDLNGSTVVKFSRQAISKKFDEETEEAGGVQGGLPAPAEHTSGAEPANPPEETEPDTATAIADEEPDKGV